MQYKGIPLLRTKLDLPPPRAHTILRQRLLEQVASAPGGRLLLLSAPAGFGKTTFLATWCRTIAAQRGAAVAWLALDEGDNDPARFLAYLVAAAAQALAPEGLPAGMSGADGEALLAGLVNALAVIERDVVIVLDDYHLISAPAVHAAVAFLLEYLPNRACLAIGSRADPPLALARLRAHEQLIELRAADLRFTPDEIRAFFAASQLALTAEEIRAVGAHVEGWPVGVQLVALSLRVAPQAWGTECGETRLEPPINQQLHDRLSRSQQQAFAYLADDVFEQQPAHLKAFLLQTAILDRMSGPLCDAVLGLAPDERPKTKDEPAFNNLEGLPNGSHLLSSFVLRPSSDSYSRLVLEELEHANLFVQPLDDQHCWYRYHHLFRAFLCARLDHEPPSTIASLHRRASAWYEQHQFLPSAVEHALAAGDVACAAALIESAATTLVERGEYATLHAWLERIPEPALAARPALCLWAAWAALLAGEVERIAPLARHAEGAWLAASDRPKLGELAHLQAHLARLRHNPAETIAYAEQALARLAERQLTLRAGSLLALGAGQLMAGDLAAARATLADAYIQCQEHNFLGLLVAVCCLGDLAAQGGQLDAAASRYQEVIALVGARPIWEGAAAALSLGDLARERNDLDRALDLLQSALRAAEQAGVAVYLPGGYIALARTHMARGNGAAAAAALERALHAARRLESPAYARRARAEQARLALAQGDLEAALSWQAGAGPEIAGAPDPTRTAEALIEARVLIAQGRAEPRSPALHTAQMILARLRDNAAAHQHTSTLIETLALIALATAAAGCREQAYAPLQQALLLAQPHGYARMFLDEGAPMRSLLTECRAQVAQSNGGLERETARSLQIYIENLLSALSDHRIQGTAPRLSAGQSTIYNLQSTMIEPLSDRELEVLRLIAEGASNQTISTTLTISIGTVKSHINHILGKLAARNRTEAVAHARELRLIAG